MLARYSFIVLLCSAAPMAVAETINQDPRLISAFFGLDNALPFGANRFCLGAWRKDGMPVVLSHTIDPDTLDPEDFQIVTESGEAKTPRCLTLQPANDPGEFRTVLLVGELGDAPDNPPVSVQVVGDLLSDGALPINFKGARTTVTPLDAGPSLVLAERVPKSGWLREARGTDCPANGIEQVIRVTWDGGVRLPNGDEPGDAEREAYRVLVQRAAGTTEEVSPVALAELNDNDNHHFLCLDTADAAIAVSFPAGRLVDPNGDLNPATTVAVRTGSHHRARNVTGF